MSPSSVRPLEDAHWSLLAPLRSPRAASVPVTRRSLYVPMRDGVPIAIDVHLPSSALGSAPARLPTIVRQTRYFRRVRVRPPFDNLPLASLPDLYLSMRARFLDAGYAWVDVDVRGSGASGGTQPFPWGPDERRDGSEILTWITQQPWSDGRAGSLGFSYDGTCAEFLAAERHPALRAAAPMFSLFDVYADVAFPGGLHLAWFTESWSRFNRHLDANEFPRAVTLALRSILRAQLTPLATNPRTKPLATALSYAPAEALQSLGARVFSLVYDGAAPVDDDPDGAQLARAIAPHAANFDVHAGALGVTHRDDAGLSPSIPEATIDAFSPHASAPALHEANVPLYSISGWRDGAYPHSAVKRHLTVRTPGSRLLLGPFCHAGKLYASPSRPARPVAFDLTGELLRFFDLHVRGREGAPSISAEPTVHFYVTGSERWESSSQWPPSPGESQEILYLGARELSPDPATEELAPAYERTLLDQTAGSGFATRWRVLLGADIKADYADWPAHEAHMLVYTSSPLDAELTVAGHALAELTLALDGARDAAVFAYLCDVAPDETSSYVTEGCVRVLHRALASAHEAPTQSPAPVRTFTRAHAAPAPSDGTPFALEVDLLPVAHTFLRGHRVRLALAFSDADHFRAIEAPHGAQARVHHGKGHRARLRLPVLPAR